jgi:hypothetical protein
LPSSGGGPTIANLTLYEPSPQCYTGTLESFDAPWNDTLFFGGTGGTNC